MVDKKTCAECGELKPATEVYFYRDRRRRDGLRNSCKECNKQNEKRAGQYKKTIRNIYARSYRIRNKKKINEYMRRYTKTYTRRYYLKNKERYISHAHKYRARKTKTFGTFTESEVKEQLKRQRGKCYWCGGKIEESKMHRDHVIPLSKGGSNHISNIVCACPTCNLSKGSKLPHEFGDKLL